MAKQVINGLAFEYAIAKAFGEHLQCDISINKSLDTGEEAYYSLNQEERKRVDVSANDIATFLIQRDQSLDTAKAITLQGNQAGKRGDVRDLIITCDGESVGISAKHRHYALKHPRLSRTIDFGKEWGAHPVSDQYWKQVNPIFDDLDHKSKQGMMFRDIPNKPAVVYLPILSAFEDELRRLCEDYGKVFIKRFFQYLIGQNDFYKVVCDNNESIVESVNINGTLAWGSQWKIPERIENIKRNPNSQSTLIATFEGGWQIKFRLHSARSKAEPSLKFDIGFVGMSSKVNRTTLPFSEAV